MASDLDELVRDLYGSACDPALLPAFLEKYADRVGAFSGVIVLTDLVSGNGRILCSCRTEQRYSKLYEEYFGGKNVYVEALRSRGVRFLAAPGEALCPDHKLVQSEYYNDYLRPQHVRFSLGMVYASDEVQAHLGVTRPTAHGPFEAVETSVATALAPHFAQAMVLYHRFYRLRSRCEALENLAERLPCGVLWLDANGRVSDANGKGSQLLRAGDGLRAEKGVLCAALTGETGRLRQLIARATGKHLPAGAGSLRITRRSGARPYALSAFPIHSPDSRHRAIMMIVDPGQPYRLNAHRLAELFQLTPTEAAVSASLAEGLSVAEIAAELGIGVGTVRSHLKQVFVKTETSRQAELVRLLLASSTCADEQPPAIE